MELRCNVDIDLINGKGIIKIANKEYDINLDDILENKEQLVKIKIRQIAMTHLYAPVFDYSTESRSELLKEYIINNLTYAIMNNKVVNIPYRGIGKTSFLVEFAKEFNLPLVVKKQYNYSLVHGYEEVYNVESIKQCCNHRTILVDEIETEDVDELRKMGFKVSGIVRDTIYY